MAIEISENDIINNDFNSSNFNDLLNKILKEQNSIKQNDLVIHIEYGLGKFVCLEKINDNDFIRIEYADNTFLLVPVENFDLITKYSEYNEFIKLDKLNSRSWSEKKKKIRKKLNDIASKLIQIAAERKNKKSQVFTVNYNEYNEFCKNFRFNPTIDQLRAIEDIKKDLSSGIVMDRLLCGDVGFGKTEVAIRASFFVVDNKYKAQVAIIVPTTLLCRQHYKSFKERFEGINIKIASLSRFTNQKDTNIIKNDLENGKIDIIIGTHSLLNKDIKFKNLGLCIIDEEQRFGVMHKEKLKELRFRTHILSMSATPIPRTLQMSLHGIKDLSLLTTPPVNRNCVNTELIEYNDDKIKFYINKEIESGGRVFFVVPRIADIKEVEARLKISMPELSYCIVHGQMIDDKIDIIMNDFYDGKYKVLIATTIIESGIDIPIANTMIIYRANNFGLAQLYQLRGRVGRSEKEAYTILTYKRTESISDSSKKRLKTINEIKSLNAGFIISSEDMDLRGAGNILGEAQTGHLKEIGIELYNKMLKVAINKQNILASNIEIFDFSPEIRLDMPTIIPDSYIDNLNIKMKFYKRIADIENLCDKNKITKELEDEYGILPESVSNLLKISLIKIKCKTLNIQKLYISNESLVIKFYRDNFEKSDKLIDYILTNKSFKVKQNELIFNFSSNVFEAIDNLLNILENI